MKWFGSDVKRMMQTGDVSSRLPDDRAPVLSLVLPLLSALVLASVATIATQPDTHLAELAYFAGGGLALAVLAVMFRLRRVSHDLAAWTTLAIAEALILERVLTLFLNGYFDDPARSFFMPVFACMPLLYLIAFVLLSAKRATWTAIALWLSMAVLITGLTLPYWTERPLRTSLFALTSFVWFGHGLFVILFAAWARRQQALIERHVALIDSERRAREAASESEARFRGIFEVAAVSINVTDEDGRYLMVNQGMVDMLGYTREELLGMDFRAVTPAADLEQLGQMAGQVAGRTLDQFRREKRYVRKDGGIVYAEIAVRELAVSAGQERRFICVALDISERKRVDEQASEDRRIRDFHFENTPLAVVEFGPDMSIRRWSRRAEQLFGWSEAEAVGRTAEQLGLFPPEQETPRRERVGRMFRGEQDHVSAVVPMEHRSGRKLWIEVHNSVTRDATGQVQAVVSMALDITRSEEILHQLNQSEARFRGIFEVAAVGINVTDESGRYLMVNQRMVDMLGYTREELLERNFRSVTLPADVGESDRLNLEVAAGTTRHFSQEKRYVRKDGGIVHTEIFVRELVSSAGQQRNFICVVLDISERKRAEAQAIEDRRVRDFHFENTPLGVVEFTPDLRIRRWSRRAEELFGWSEAEAMGKTAEELGVIPPEHVALRRERMDRLFGGEQDQYSAVVPMTHRSGQRRWLEVHNSVTRDAEGRAQTLISMVLDITERQEMMRLLDKNEARFRGVFEQAAVGMAVLDAGGRWLKVNRKLCEITGYESDELLQIDSRTITYPDDLAGSLALVQQIVSGAIDKYSLDKRYLRKDGSVVWIALFVGRIEATADTAVSFVAVIEDINERKAAEARFKALTASLELQVSERTAQLHEIIRGGQRRNEELTLIAEMSQLLSAANNLGEAGQVVMLYLPRIFLQADGALYLADATHESFQRKTHWGAAPPGAPVFPSADCWALRRGEIHHVEGEADALYCPHVSSHSYRHPHLCVPIQTLGAQMGLIELAWGRAADGWAPEMPLVKMVADKIGLAFGNLRLREELSRQALIDPLTGLNNRRWLENWLRARVARHARSGEGFAVLMIDVDHFKSVNDEYGHEAGDRALREIGRVLASSVREDEAVARFGGEEFTVVLDTDHPSQAMAAGQRIREAVACMRVQFKDGEPLALTVSIGVALFPLDGADAQNVIERADAALYEAKHRGRDRVSLFASVGTPALN
ncbi:MAG: PAS domain S-box protein [Panacagrimonas sp.]